MMNPLLTHTFEDQILDLIDNQDKWTRSDVQSRVSAIVNEILVNGYRLIDDLNKAAAARKLGSLGGRSTSDKLGKDHYRKLAENMNRKRREKKQPSEAH